MTNAVQLSEVSKSYGDHLAVDQLDLQVPAGSIYGFIGPNGSGKTSTIRMILQIIHPDSGTVEVLGQRGVRSANDQIGYLPEERGLYKKMTVGKLLAYYASLKGMPKRAICPAIDQWLDRLGLSDWKKAKIEALSKGMAQKIQFISAAIANPKLLILDEPFSGLDPVNAEVLRAEILRLREAGTTVIFSTHDMSTAETLCDSLFMIHRGKKVLDGTLTSIQDKFGADTIRLRAAPGVAAKSSRANARPRRTQRSRAVPRSEALRKPARATQAPRRSWGGAVVRDRPAITAGHFCAHRRGGDIMIDKILRIARAEYLNSVTSKAFVIGVLVTPVMIVGSMLVEKISAKAKGSQDRKVAIIDYSGKLFPALEKRAEIRNKLGVMSEGKKVRPGFLLESVEPSDDENSLIWELSERVRRKEIFGFAILGTDLLTAESPSIRYYTNTPTYQELPNWLRAGVDEELQRERFLAAEIDANQIRSIMRRTGIKKMELAEKDSDGAVTTRAGQDDLLTSMVPSIGMFLLFMMVMTSAPTLLNSTLEEKINKISEFLVSAVSPFELMMGKLIGALLTAITLSITYLMALSYIAHRYGILESIPLSLFLWFFVFLILAMMTFGSFCLAIGAACSEIRDAQSLMMPLIILMTVPVLLWQPVMQNPSSSFATAASLIPTFTPMLLYLRLAIPPGVPWWELVIGVVGCTLFMLFAVWAAAKIFRIGILSQGQAPSLTKIVKWVFNSRD